MSEKEKKILETFKRIFPKLNERDKDRLLWIGEGLSLKTENTDHYKQTG